MEPDHGLDVHRLPRLGVHSPAEYVKAMAVRLPRGTVDGVAFDRGHADRRVPAAGRLALPVRGVRERDPGLGGGARDERHRL